MTTSSYRLTAERVTQAILVAGFLMVIAANMPGHLSNDSVRQLHEAHLQMRETWGPVVYAAILGFFDGIVPGTGLYLVCSVFLLFATLWGLMRLSGRVSWFAPVVALVFVSSPTVMLYQGIVWKDVLFSNLGVASFVLLAQIARARRAGSKPWLAIAAVIVTLAFAMQVRQNGGVIVLIAGLTLAWILRNLGWARAMTWGVGLIASVLLVSQGLSVLCTPARSQVEGLESQGFRSIFQYDILGTVAHDKSLRLSVIASHDPIKARNILTYAVPLYAPERIDFISLDPRGEGAIGAVPTDVLARQWMDLVTHHPQTYLAHRLDVFRATFMTPNIDSCIPIFVGVDGPKSELEDLRIPKGVDPADQKVYNYSSQFLDTPFFSHVAYGVIGTLSVSLLLFRRTGSDFAMIGLVVAGFAFASTFLLISIACDYRYIYFLDLASMVSLFYLSLDPPQLRFRTDPKS